ncbi:MAG: YggT family protein [Firmicutes bacterium HGW-Firmicutes-14]|nr:MAG: YggT family protein [Firmicutes bacterium HGW-Firmicutes-14]
MNIIDIVDIIFKAIWWLILARIILSFLPMFMNIDPYNPVVRFINETTEPLMAPFRRLIPPVGGLDLSPIVLFLVLQILHSVVRQVLISLLY